MRTLPSTMSLYRALKAQGFDLPDECAYLELLLPAEGVGFFQLRMTVNLTHEKMVQVGRALEAIGEHRVS